MIKLLLVICCGLCFGLKAQSLSAPDASVVLLVYSAFTCPYSAQANKQLEQLQKRYPKQLKIVFKHFPMSDNEEGFTPHLLAAAAQEQGKAALMQSYLFEQQQSANKDSPLIRAGRYTDMGLDAKILQEAIGSGRVREKILQDIAEAHALKARVTPTYFIDGVKLEGLQDVEVLSRLIDFGTKRK